MLHRLVAKKKKKKKKKENFGHISKSPDQCVSLILGLITLGGG